nr:Toll/interleukin-1 receptor (TIR) domain-containing protein [Tanacetum cinerariifolium]
MYKKTESIKIQYWNVNERTLDLSVASILESLNIENCKNLVEVHFPVTPNLKELRIYRCDRLEKLHMPAECPKLVNIKLNYLKLRTVHLGITPNLETLKVKNCTDMVEPLMPAQWYHSNKMYKKTESIKIQYWNVNESLPKTFQAKILVGLQMDYSRMVQLRKDGEEKPFTNLMFLKFTNSYSLRTIDLSVAPILESLNIENCKNVVEVHFPVTPNLKELCIYRCDRLENLHMPAECPKLVNIKLNYLKLRTVQLGITPNLETLKVKNCTDM